MKNLLLFLTLISFHGECWGRLASGKTKVDELKKLEIHSFKFIFKNASNDPPLGVVRMTWNGNTMESVNGQIVVPDCSSLEGHEIIFSHTNFHNFTIKLIQACKMKEITIYLFPAAETDDPNVKNQLIVKSENSFAVMILEMNPATRVLQSRFTNARSIASFSLASTRVESILTFGSGDRLPQIHIIRSIQDDTKIDVVLSDDMNPKIIKYNNKKKGVVVD